MPRPSHDRLPEEYFLRDLPTSVTTINQALEHYSSETNRLATIQNRLASELLNYRHHQTQTGHQQGDRRDYNMHTRWNIVQQQVFQAAREFNLITSRHHDHPDWSLQQILGPYMSTPADSETESEEEGGGIASAAKAALTSILHGGRRSAPPAVRKILEQNPSAKIVKAQAAVVPVGKPLQSVLNWISGGKYEEKRQKLGYNDINHAYMIITLDNGKTYRLEKNHVVEMYGYNVNNDKNAKIDLQLSEQPLLSSFLGNAEKYQESTKAEGKRGNFWQYDPQNNNCQYFVDDLVKGNAEVQNKEEANKFFFQPGSGELIDATGKWKPHVKFLVPLATIGDRLINGQGIPQRRCAYRYRPY